MQFKMIQLLLNGLSKYYKDTQTTQRHTKTRKATQRHTKTRKDTQRNAKTRQRHLHSTKTLKYSVKVPKRHQIGIQKFHLDKQRQLKMIKDAVSEKFAVQINKLQTRYRYRSIFIMRKQSFLYAAYRSITKCVLYTSVL